LRNRKILQVFYVCLETIVPKNEIKYQQKKDKRGTGSKVNEMMETRNITRKMINE
jgi:hypothetical protein